MVARWQPGAVVLRWLLNPLALALLCGVGVFLLIASPDDKQPAAPGGRAPQQAHTPLVAGTRLPHVVDSGERADG